MLILTLPLNLILAAVLAACQPPPPPPTEAQPETESNAETDRQEIDSAEELLDALESADDELRDFSALMRYTTEQGLLGDIQVRRGELFYRQLSDSDVRQFAVHFNQLRIGDTIETISKDWVFDGRWLVERLNDDRQFFKREVIGPKQEFDALSIDGPFPLPIGQKKSDILRRFAPSLVEPDTEGRLAGFFHLHLDARRPDDAGEELNSVDLWYDPETLLPVKAVVVEKGGDVSTVELAPHPGADGFRINRGVDADLFNTTTPPLDENWKIEVSRLGVEAPDR